MRVLFGAPLSEDEKQQITPVVYNNTIVAMKMILQAILDMGYEGNKAPFHFHYTRKSQVCLVSKGHEANLHLTSLRFCSVEIEKLPNKATLY